MIFLCVTTQTYALAFFMPIILVFGLGFEVGPAQCLVAPPYVFAAIVMIACAWIGDKYKVRGPLLIFNATIAIIGLAVMGWVETVGVRYFGIFLVSLPHIKFIQTITDSSSFRSALEQTATSHRSCLTKETTSVDSGSVPSAVPPLSALVVLVVLLDLWCSAPRTPPATFPVSGHASLHRS